MIVIIGKTASGKDTILNTLIKQYNYQKIITYTTRSLRKGEIQDVTYHYISEEEFKQKIEDGFFAEWKIYHAIEGDVYYGSSVKSYENADDKSIIILTPDGYRDVKDSLDFNHKSFYIYANNATIKKRLLERGDKKEEAERRLIHDNEDFKHVVNEVDNIIYNNEKDNIEDVVSKLLSYI